MPATASEVTKPVTNAVCQWPQRDRSAKAVSVADSTVASIVDVRRPSDDPGHRHCRPGTTGIHLIGVGISAEGGEVIDIGSLSPTSGRSTSSTKAFSRSALEMTDQPKASSAAFPWTMQQTCPQGDVQPSWHRQSVPDLSQRTWPYYQRLSSSTKSTPASRHPGPHPARGTRHSVTVNRSRKADAVNKNPRSCWRGRWPFVHRVQRGS